MIIKEYTNKHVDRYINGEMPDPEKENFRKALERDSNLRSRLILRQMIVESIQKETENMQEKADRHAKSRLITRRILQITTLIFFLLFIIGSSRKYKTQDLFTEYFFIPFFEYSSNIDKSSANEALTNNELIALYNQKAYPETITLYKEKWRTDSIIPPTGTLLVVAICAMHSDDTPLAISILEQVQQPDYQEKADWLLLCCYLQENKRGKAVETADRIIKNGDRLSDKAFEIKNKLEQRIWF